MNLLLLKLLSRKEQDKPLLCSHAPKTCLQINFSPQSPLDCDGNDGFYHHLLIPTHCGNVSPALFKPAGRSPFLRLIHGKSCFLRPATPCRSETIHTYKGNWCVNLLNRPSSLVQLHSSPVCSGRIITFCLHFLRTR